MFFTHFYLMSLVKFPHGLAMNPVKPRSNLFDWLHGKVYYLDGIHGTLEMLWGVRGAGYARLYHCASVTGKETDAYKMIKRELGDDWVTDLTDEIERYVAIAINLGYCFDEQVDLPDLDEEWAPSSVAGSSVNLDITDAPTPPV